MMEAKKKYEKPAFRLVTDLGSILECLYEVYGTDGTMLIAGNKLSDTVIYPFIRMIKKKCKAVDAEKAESDALEDLYGKFEKRRICDGC